MSKSSPDLIRYLQDRICRRLQIDDFNYVEIESKKRVLPSQAKDLKRYLDTKKKIKHEKTNFSFDQFLDTPQMTLFRRGASLRLRYKRGGSKVFLQYKGPGYIEEKVLYRSEFTSAPLKHVMREESHHDIIRFSQTSVRDILRRHVEPAMVNAIKKHVGALAIGRLTIGSLICVYQKEKYSVDLGPAQLEPSLDRVCAFHINKYGPHPLSTFWEYENEIKAPPRASAAKLIYLPKLLKFERNVDEEFDLVPERLDKYHRCASIFLK